MNTQSEYDMEQFHHVADICRKTDKEVTISAEIIISVDGGIQSLQAELADAKALNKRILLGTKDWEVGYRQANDDAEQLRRELAASREREAKLRECVEAVEWNGIHHNSLRTCPWCWQDEVAGHADDCQRQLTLERTGSKK